VQVCPTGIDIRDGLQAACIDCGACIDACDNVMLKLGKETGLIEFYSEEQLNVSTSTSMNTATGAKDALCSVPLNGEATKSSANDLSEKNSTPSFMSFRLFSYLAIFIITLAGVFYGLQNKTELIIEIAKERGSLYQVEGSEVCNNYQIELEAFSKNLTRLHVHITHETPSIPLRLIGSKEVNLTEQNNTYIYRVCAPKKYVSSRSEIEFSFTQQQFYASKKSTFLGPK
jgi:polyferredoxin